MCQGKNFYLVIAVMMVLLLLNPVTILAYGWGYKKGKDEQAPQFGIYSEMLNKTNAIYLDNSGEKIIYLTFDNGYEQGYTADVLNILKKYGVNATFFVTGHYAKSEPNLLKRMVDEGHIIGNHSYHHPDFTRMTKDEMKKELDSLESVVAEHTSQKKTIYLRPPRGTFSEQTIKWAEELGYVHVFWSLAFKDWEVKHQKGADYAFDQITSQIHPGAIILLHTVSEDNAGALEKVILHLKDEGYEFGNLDDLMMKQLLPESFIY